MSEMPKWKVLWYGDMWACEVGGTEIQACADGRVKITKSRKEVVVNDFA